LNQSDQTRILYVIPGEEHGSSMIFSKREARSVARAGVITRCFFLETRTQPVVLAREWLRLRRELHAFTPHIVHAHYGTVTASLCALASSTPLVMTLHNAELNHELDISFVREKCGHLLSQLAALKASRIVCVSDELKRKLWWRQDRVSIIPSSVDLEAFRPLPRAEARASLNWDPSEPVVLFYAGRNPQTKRLDLALDVAAQARAIHGPFRLEILRWQVDPDRVPLYLNAADCLLCTSSSEGSPTIVKEAMACNLPVVSVDVGDVRERIEGLDNCHIRTSFPDDLAAALVSVLQSGRRSNGRIAAATVSTEACRHRLLALYERLLEGTGRTLFAEAGG
jgi:teichuronic acid biosynthesis glycosyltransferase TuaC